MRTLRADPVGVLLRADDPLVHHDRLRLADLSERHWFRFPWGTDPVRRSYWNGGSPRARAPWCAPSRNAYRPCYGTARSAGLAPLGHDLPAELTAVPLTDMPPSRVVEVWNAGDTNPLLRSFIETATAAYRP